MMTNNDGNMKKIGYFEIYFGKFEIKDFYSKKLNFYGFLNLSFFLILTNYFFYILDEFSPLSTSLISLHGSNVPKSFAVDPKLLYHCRKCGKAYETRYSCVRHENTLCGIEPRFRCVYCEFRTKYKYNLKVHYQYKHKGEMEHLEKTAKMCNLMTKTDIVRGID